MKGPRKSRSKVGASSRRAAPAARSAGLAAALALILGGAAGCFTEYGRDCSRNVDLPCFWEGAGGTSMTTATAPPPTCGDGALDPGEACDDGNAIDCDGCRADCSAKETGCGDGFACGSEECDAGDANQDTGACTTACTLAACGDNHVQPGEECDDGNDLMGDGCVECQSECQVGTLVKPEEAESKTVRFVDPLTLQCYVLVNETSKSWAGARSQCISWGGQLLSWAVASEHQSVTKGLLSPGQSPAWTDGNLVESGDFVWSNNDMPLPDDVPWDTGEPDISFVACVTIQEDGTLKTAPCDAIVAVKSFICERSLTP